MNLGAILSGVRLKQPLAPEFGRLEIAGLDSGRSILRPGVIDPSFESVMAQRRVCTRRGGGRAGDQHRVRRDFNHQRTGLVQVVARARHGLS